MKHLFVEVKYTGKVQFTQELLDQTPKRLVICSNIQYLDFLPQLKDFLEKGGKEVQVFQSRHGQYSGQILGCDVFPFSSEKEFDAFLYLGDGLFHPTALLYRNEKSVFMYCPRGETIKELDLNYLESLKKKKKGRLAKFIVSKEIGVLVTRKPGQNQSLAVENFRKEMSDKGKNIYVFLTDNINVSKLEDFNFIEMWVNTGCPRIIEDFKCVNLRDLQEISYFSGKEGVF
ncbi:hypothetical protein CL619_03515 [archaeon]|nr:hypothetical protein [archaeon]